MKPPHLPDIRAVLRACPEGLTVNQMRPHLPKIRKPNTIRKCLDRMPDAYIDRWVLNPGKRGQYEAVWCVVVPPPHCPYPTERYNGTAHAVETRWAEKGQI